MPRPSTYMPEAGMSASALEDQAVVRHVYVGDYGAYRIPANVLAVAWSMNGGGDRLGDRRTRGAKFIAAWGKTEDARHATPI